MRLRKCVPGSRRRPSHPPQPPCVGRDLGAAPLRLAKSQATIDLNTAHRQRYVWMEHRGNSAELTGERPEFRIRNRAARLPLTPKPRERCVDSPSLIRFKMPRAEAGGVRLLQLCESSSGNLKPSFGLSSSIGESTQEDPHESNYPSSYDGSGDGDRVCNSEARPRLLRPEHLLCNPGSRKSLQQVLRLHCMERLAAARQLGQHAR